ncbi:MAG: GlxA family transcriptional regulator, partial [Alphaproteobacteria bacterium]|nr:GlxA family transcriptional regulator [Alphaproteobacteria bacterium]
MKVPAMYKDIGEGKTEHISLFLVPQFSMIAFTSLIEPLRLANQIAERKLYTWEIISRDGLPVMASNGIEITPNT